MARSIVICTGFVIASLLFAGPSHAQIDPEKTLGIWLLDEGQGNTTKDATGNGHDGTLMNSPSWIGGHFGSALRFSGSSTYVTCGNADDLNVNVFSVSFWCNIAATQTWNHMISRGQHVASGTPGSVNWGVMMYESQATILFEMFNDTGWTGISTGTTTGEWHHVVATYDGSAMQLYHDGQLGANTSGAGALLDASRPFIIGARSDAGSVGGFFNGSLDEVGYFNAILTAEDIQTIMTKGLAEILGGTPEAADPRPVNGATDVVRDRILGWTPGMFAATHDVYLGTSLDDVSNADRSNPLGTLVSQGQTDPAFDADGLLEYGQTYYWRIDEVNGAPDNTIFNGPVWSFTVETFAYPITGVTAKASSAQTASPASRTVDGSGLDAFDQHGVDLKTMWATPGGLPAWIEYTFDKEYKLHELWVWNGNSELESYMGFGAKEVTIEYSTDGETWNQLENVPEFAQGSGTPTYTANTIVNLGEVMAKYVKLTINTTWGATGIANLSEVRFFYTPALAFEPDPADGATGVDLATTLNWRPGREATSHEVYFDTDANAVADGAVTAETVTDHRFTPASMDFGTKYYWRVDEVGDAGAYAGSVWSFTAQEFELVEDFESYDDDMEAGTTIWHAWIDGLTTGASGSQVGYTDAPFAEKTIVHSGMQSMPLMYDNATKFFFSEAEREFDPVQNWTGNGADQVGLWTRGYPALTTVQVTETGGKMDLTGSGADIWNNTDEFTYAYKTLSGDGTLVARVVSVGTGTQTWAKGGVMIRDSLNGGSTHAMMVLTANSDGAAGNGASFQYRVTTNGGSANTDSATVIAPPYWVRIQRFGESLTGSVSADGKTWTQIGTTAITMTDPVHIGICVTSHLAGENRTYQFDSITATGTVTGTWQGAVINSPQYNAAANMHVTIQDSAGKSATVVSDTAATAADWTLWSIPMSDFAGVNFTKVKKMAITIGDKNATAPGGTGIVFIDDIAFGHAAE